jgi:hypothetical protein
VSRNIARIKLAAAVLLSLPLIAALGVAVWWTVMFEERTVREGEAYGFSIGDTSTRTYERAVELRAAGEIAEIRRGVGSSATLLDERYVEYALADDAWTLVVNPDWWNDSITLRFRDRQLVEIYRFRLCCELP